MVKDLFLSYRRKDDELVRAFKAALEAAGVSVWLDAEQIEPCEPFSEPIRCALVHARALLAWYSKDYPESVACQWELTAAYLAGQREGDPARRVWVVNPEADERHLALPAELAGQNIPRVDAAGLADLAAGIARRLDSLPTRLGDILPVARPPSHNGQPMSNPHFVGRLADMWALHGLLHCGADTIITASGPAVGAQVRGMGGVGKTQLAEEYALRFGPAYPGGIFWLRVQGRNDDENKSPADLEIIRHDQWSAIAGALQIPPGRDPAERAAALAAKLTASDQPFLWVVDDFPSGQEAEGFKAWLAPAPRGHTLFTTRSHAYGLLGKSLALDILPEAEALALLVRRREPESTAERSAARRIAVELLGGHPLALEVAGAALAAVNGIQSFAEFADELAGAQGDELESLVADFRDALPTGHQKSIAATLLRSVKALDEDGRDFLRLASCLDAAPIPAKLVLDVFARAGELASKEARRRAARGLAAAEKLSLVNPSDKSGAWRVHALVLRTVRFHDDQPDRRERLAKAAVAVLYEALDEGVDDIRNHPALEREVLHARALAQGRQDRDGAVLMTRVARHDHERGDYASAQRLWEESLRIFEGSARGKDRDTLRVRSSLAAAIGKQGDLVRARRIEEEVLAARFEVLGEDDPDTLTSMTNLVGMLHALGEYGQAQQMGGKALDLSRRLKGPEHPVTLLVMGNLASVLGAQGKLDAAADLKAQVLSARIRVLGDDHPDTLIAMSNLASASYYQGDYARARELGEQTLALRRRLLGPRHPDTLTTAGILACALGKLGELEAAREMEDEILDASIEALGEAHPDTLTAFNNLATTVFRLGDRPRACQLLGQALSIQRRVLGKDHPDTLVSAWNLFCVMEGSSAEAVSLFDEYLRELVDRRPEDLPSADHRQIRELALPYAESMRRGPPSVDEPNTPDHQPINA